MKDWDIAGNDLPEWRSGTVTVYDMPWWLWFCDQFVDRILDPICCSHCNPLVRIPLPKWLHITDEDGTRYSLREYYGTVGDLLHIYIYVPCMQWVWKRKYKTSVNVEIGFDKLRELFEATHADSFKHFDEREIERADEKAPDTDACS